MNANGKYLKDENGNIFSPIVGTKSIFDSQGSNLDSCLFGEILFQGNNNSSTITLSKSLNNYRSIGICWRRNGSSNDDHNLGRGSCYSLHYIGDLPHHVNVVFAHPSMDAHICQYTGEILLLSSTSITRAVGCMLFGLSSSGVVQHDEYIQNNTNLPWTITQIYAFK